MLRHGSSMYRVSASTKRWASGVSHGATVVQRMRTFDLEEFKTSHFQACRPTLLPKSDFIDIPAITKWFKQTEAQAKLNVDYLHQFQNASVPVELYRPATTDREALFQRNEIDLALCLSMINGHRDGDDVQLYVAQCPIASLPLAMQQDVPTPDLVKLAGKGDIYDSSIWLGQAPTFTPLHKDPNPNLFVQLCGTKIVRMIGPAQGEGVMHTVRNAQSETNNGFALRGEEMMVGQERELLEELVWNCPSDGVTVYEAEVEAGDGLFIPKGWWHSIKGVGQGVIGSANWWFR